MGARESMAIEMLTDSTVAATALVFEVMRELPRLRICLCHGGGTFTWAYPRLRYFDMEHADDPAATGAALAGAWRPYMSTRSYTTRGISSSSCSGTARHTSWPARTIRSCRWRSGIRR